MKRLNRFTHKQKGFTLIELVVVIVILGILAVTAAPKFINLQDDARTATLQAIKASMQSASTLVHSKSLIKGNESADASTTTSVNVNGKTLKVKFGYPLATLAASSTTNADWTDLLDLDSADFKSVVLTTDEYVVYPANNIEPTAITDTCIVYYTQAADANTKSTATVVDCI